MQPDFNELSDGSRSHRSLKVISFATDTSPLQSYFYKEQQISTAITAYLIKNIAKSTLKVKRSKEWSRPDIIMEDIGIKGVENKIRGITKRKK